MIIENGAIVLPGRNKPVLADIRIDDGGRISEIAERGAHGSISGGDEDVLDATGLIILPGGIDPHVHFDEPGYTHREDFFYGSCAAAAGGITTVIDMPCTSIPPVTDGKSLYNKLRTVERRSVVDFGLFGGVSGQTFKTNFPKGMKELAPWVLGFKTYFISGMAGFEHLNHHQFYDVLCFARELARPVLLHAEDYQYVKSATTAAKVGGNSPIDYYRSRPELAEIIAVSVAVEMAEQTDADLHIVHISTARSAEIVANSKNVTCETAPHYLQFTTDDFCRIGSALKTTPPVKSKGNRERLWDMLANGAINFVASDHAPCPNSEKNTGSIWTDYAGIPGTETLLPYLFSEGYLGGKITLKRLVEVTSEMAAKRYGIYDRKGSIAVGKDADLVFINPEENWTVRGEKFFSKGKITPFEGMKLRGRIVKTILRGKVIYDFQKGVIAEPGWGRHCKSGK